MRRMVAIADDLSGAAEIAAATASISLDPPTAVSGSTAEVVLVPADIAGWSLPTLDGHDVWVFDSDGRTAEQVTATERLRQLLAALERGAIPQIEVFLKVDSTMRGHFAHDVAVLFDRGPVVLALALPGLGRTTLDGVVTQDGEPLHKTDLWHGEGRPAPHSIAAAVAPLPAEVLGTALLREAPQEYERLLATLGRRGVVPICDAETTDDLDRIARAAVRVGAQPVGSSAFGFAVAKALLCDQGELSTAPSLSDVAGVREGRVDEGGSLLRSHNPVLVVVGTMSSQGRAQLDVLADSGVPIFAIPPDKLLNGAADPASLRMALRAGPVAVTVGSSRIKRVGPAVMAFALASFVRPLAQGVPLVLTGGATARAVLDSLGVRRLSTLGEIEQGAVLSRTDTGALVVTRPGAFGGVGSLRLILDRLAQFEQDAARSPHSEVAP